MKIQIDGRGADEAVIKCSQIADHKITREAFSYGEYWVLRAGRSFNAPVRYWRVTPRRSTLQQAIPEILEFILASHYQFRVRDTWYG